MLLFHVSLETIKHLTFTEAESMIKMVGDKIGNRSQDTIPLSVECVHLEPGLCPEQKTALQKL